MTSFREKTLWSQLLLTIYIAYYYLSSLTSLSPEQLADSKVITKLLLKLFLFRL